MRSQVGDEDGPRTSLAGAYAVKALLKRVWVGLKNFWCWFPPVGHSWEWKRVGTLEFGRRVIYGPPFSCLRCGEVWRIDR